MLNSLILIISMIVQIMSILDVGYAYTIAMIKENFKYPRV